MKHWISKIASFFHKHFKLIMIVSVVGVVAYFIIKYAKLAGELFKSNTRLINKSPAIQKSEVAVEKKKQKKVKQSIINTIKIADKPVADHTNDSLDKSIKDWNKGDS